MVKYKLIARMEEAADSSKSFYKPLAYKKRIIIMNQNVVPKFN